jgi:hypothetical protein
MSGTFGANIPFNVNTSHPLIPNSQEYIYYKKFISIHSEDRDILKFPNSSEFEIELPEDYLNVVSMRLIDWKFPDNYNIFSEVNGNIVLAFNINAPYNPAAFGLSDEYNYRIFEALFTTQSELYSFVIEEGSYTPTQMVTELTNKFNFAVTKRITTYFTQQGWTDTLDQFNANGGYSRFVVVYNTVSSKIWFGNNADGFVIVNDITTLSNLYSNNLCVQRVPNSSNWGLPSFIGLPRCNSNSVSSSTLVNVTDSQIYNGITVPRFYYGDVMPGDKGFWLLPNLDLSGSEVYWIEAPNKINLIGEAYMYMEIAGQNCIDETQPFNVSKFTLTTNQTNGIVNSSFAKLNTFFTCSSQWYDRDSLPYKLYLPPAERMRRFKFRIRYHNGQLVDFGIHNYSFMLEFTLLVPQILRSSKSVVYPPPMH